MKMRYLIPGVILMFALELTAFSAIPPRKGWWKFDDNTNLVKASFGLPLELTGSMNSVAGPAAGNYAIQIGVGSYLSMYHQMTTNGIGDKVNEYSLQIDFSIPEGEVWHSFFQINPANDDDGDLFTNLSNKIGVWEAAYSEDSIVIDTWYRLVLSVKNGDDGFFRIYVDGNLWVDAPGRTIDERYALGDTLLIFADNDEEDNEINCSELAIWDVALTDEQVAELGNATTSPGTGLRNNKSAFQESRLGQNYPNPFNLSTTIPYTVIRSGNVSFRVLDLSGREMHYFDQGNRNPGNYLFDLPGKGLPAGMYYLQMLSVDGNCISKISVQK